MGFRLGHEMEGVGGWGDFGFGAMMCSGCVVSRGRCGLWFLLSTGWDV